MDRDSRRQELCSQSRRRHPNGFFVFLNVYSNARKDSGRPSQSHKETVKEASEVWRKMSREKRDRYCLEAKAIRQSNSHSGSTDVSSPETSNPSSRARKTPRPPSSPVNETQDTSISNISMFGNTRHLQCKASILIIVIFYRKFRDDRVILTQVLYSEALRQL